MKMNRSKPFSILVLVILLSQIVVRCTNSDAPQTKEYKILFLHHSTGDAIWKGGSKAVEIKGIHLGDYDVPEWFKEYNKSKGVDYQITQRNFPAKEPYGWQNYPYDYYNIWVKNAGDKAYKEEPTLEILTKEYNVIVFKHCYPVSLLNSDTNSINIDSQEKTIQNYKLQYEALKQKMLQFPDTKFIIWTGAVMTQAQISKENAELTKSFFNWVRTTWDTENDNIFLWDFYELETDGGMYLKSEYAVAPNNSHPNKSFSQKVSPYFCQRIVDVIETNGAKTYLTGIYK